MIASINPATGEIMRTFEAATDAEIESSLARADAGWHSTAALHSPRGQVGSPPPPEFWKTNGSAWAG